MNWKLTDHITAFEDGYLHPSGIAFLYTGQLYIGETKNGFPEGIGILFNPTGGFIISRWKKGFSDGYTTQITPQGDRLEGECNNGFAVGEWSKMVKKEKVRIFLDFDRKGARFLSIDSISEGFYQLYR